MDAPENPKADPATFQVHVTAAEAWPAFERCVLEARQEITAAFRIFDLSTPLLSPEARAIGADWFDLLHHVLQRGVSLRLTISDFDPVMAADLHAMTWRTIRQGAALAALTSPEQVQIRAHMHPARAGLLPRLAFLPKMLSRRKAMAKEMPDPKRAPGLHSSDLPDIHPATHHQKLAVIDDEWLYIGGLDLNERRLDGPDHDRDSARTWSDVQLLIKGPDARDGRLHLDTFEAVTAGTIAPPDTGNLRRTMSCPRRWQAPFLSPRTVAREIEQDHLEAFAAARHLIYIETQYLRSDVIATALAMAARANPDLGLVIILPKAPDDVVFEGNRGIDARFGMALQNECLTKITEAFGPRACLASPVRPLMAPRDSIETLAGSETIHVHNKVLITDADFAHIGSANLNGRSMRWDTEASLRITQPDHIAAVRTRLLAHWWFDALPPEARDPARLVQWWSAEIARNGVRRPHNRTGFLVPHDKDVTRDMEQSLPGATENVV